MIKHLDDYHFYASSYCTWATTTPERSLAELITLMDKEKNTYSIFKVPVKWNSEYEIRWYQPQVEGTEFIETVTPQVKKKKGRSHEVCTD